MDEPTVGVDPQSRNNILETVKNLSQNGITVIYTSHYMEEIEYLCDKVAIMDSGEIKAQGTVKELKAIVGNKDTIKVFLQRPLSSEKITILKNAFNFKGEFADKEISFLVDNGSDQLVDILGKLQSLGVEVKSVDIIKPNLEKVFLHLTGKSLRD
jgi:ABC-2 type transport system ATP-binding protein